MITLYKSISTLKTHIWKNDDEINLEIKIIDFLQNEDIMHSIFY